MPNIVVKVPEGVFDPAGLQTLAKGVTAAAEAAEQLGELPQNVFLTWVYIEEVKSGHLFAGGADPLAQVIPVTVFFYPPAGVLDDASRAVAVKLVHEACVSAKPASDPRVLMTSVIVADVKDGTWGANGDIWHLADFARAAGYKHLQHLVDA